MPRFILSFLFAMSAFAANNDPSHAGVSTPLQAPTPLASPYDVCAPVYPQGFEASQGRCFIFVQRSNTAICAISTMLHEAEPMLRGATSVQCQDSFYATLMQSQKTLYATLMQSQEDYANCMSSVDSFHIKLS